MTIAHRRPRLPRGPAAALAAALAAQCTWHAAQPVPTPRLRPLPAAPRVEAARLLGLGDDVLAAKLLMLWLLGFDRQDGVSLAWRSLDYGRLRDWLALVLRLDPHAQYPLLAASRLYGEVADPARSRVMLEFVADAFEADPGRRWPWLAHAVFVARHRLHDDTLALRYAARLAAAQAPGIPGWARQLQIFVLEDIGELEAAEILIGGLLESGRLADPGEIAFLKRRLLEIAACRSVVEKSSDSSD